MRPHPQRSSGVPSPCWQPRWPPGLLIRPPVRDFLDPPVLVRLHVVYPLPHSWGSPPLPRQRRHPLFPEALSAGLFLPAFSDPRRLPPTPLPPREPRHLSALPHVAPPPPPPDPLGAAVMTGKRPRRDHAAGYSGVPNPPEARDELAPVLLRAATALVAREGAGAPSHPREPVYRSPCRRTHPHLRARGGSFRCRRPPRPPPALQQQIISPNLQAPSPLVPQLPPPLPPPPSSQQSSLQQSSGLAASSPLVASPALTSAPLTAASSLPPPLPVPPQLVSPAGAHLVPPLPAQTLVAADPLSEPPQRQHPLVSLDPAPVARFPPPRLRAQSPPLPPDAPDPEDDEKWWNGEL
ncbi:unnamed protein product [Closterium sp. Naga37s-1]|nr:unnamed protein product [Closterium sp. Naga37s-1]